MFVYLKGLNMLLKLLFILVTTEPIGLCSEKADQVKQPSKKAM
jgi:hypothetical protein